MPLKRLVRVTGGPAVGKALLCRCYAIDFDIVHISADEFKDAARDENSIWGTLTRIYAPDGIPVHIKIIRYILENSIARGLQQDTIRFLVEGFRENLEQILNFEDPASLNLPSTSYSCSAARSRDYYACIPGPMSCSFGSLTEREHLRQLKMTHGSLWYCMSATSRRAV